jgi:23S rRNA (uracil1939-C5)-methyltransferase
VRPETIAAVERLAARLDGEAAGAVISIAMAENIAGTERAAHLELAPRARVSEDLLQRAIAEAGLVGLTAQEEAMAEPHVIGHPIVTDTLAALTGNRVSGGALQRHAASFFQGNRFLLPPLVLAVADLVPDGGEVIDLYAGVGVFSVALAVLGRLEVTAVEGDRVSGADLRQNARPHAPRLDVRITSVEAYLASRLRDRTRVTLIVDPPRTGLSKEAADSIVRLGPSRIVYVSCDPPTLARDARRLLDNGYRLDGLRAFDFFPNTPHVESLAVFEATKG